MAPPVPIRDVPWGTKGNLNRIGDKLRVDPSSLTLDDTRIFAIWRAAHFNVLNAFNAMLRNRTRGKAITVARRHKRRTTIIDKLSREPGMQLARMDDVAGIRLIFQDLPALLEFRSDFLKSKHKHEKKNHDEKYNYISRPKPSGYRGIHDVYSYNSTSERLSSSSGTMIEVQYRTIHQHAWSTANEVVTMITPGQRTKFNQADEHYMEFFRLVSEMFARVFDGHVSVYPEISNAELLKAFDEVENKTWLINRLKGLNVVRGDIISDTVVLRFTPKQELIVTSVPRFQDPMKFYFRQESEHPEDDVVLVNAPEGRDIRSAYRNYFSDTTDFLSYIEQAKEILTESV